MEAMLVHKLFEDSVRKYPEKTALVFRKCRLTYAQIESAANRLSRFLLRQNVQKGDRIIVYLNNSVEAVLSIYGILKAGGCFVVVNRSTKPNKLAYIINNCQAKGLITDGKSFQNNDSHHLGNLPTVQFVIATEEMRNNCNCDYPVYQFGEIQKLESDDSPDVRCIDQDLAALIYTSGSTGSPKGVISTHLNMVSAIRSITAYLENVPSDIILNVLPLSFDYGLYQVLMAFSFGGTIILERSFAYPFEVVKKLLDEKVTGFPIVPTISGILIQLKSLRNYSFEHLRYITNTGAHLPEHHIRKLRQIFPNAKIYPMYGLTECKRVSYLPPHMIDEKPGSVGIPMPNVEVSVVDENGEPVKPGEIGELVVRGTNVMQGYWGLPEETARVFRKGKYPWERILYTGDLFRMDEDGYLYFVCRKDDIIKSRGEKVSPKEVENVIYEMEDVAEVAVVGVKDDILGQAIKAFVVPRNGARLTANQIKKYCASRLEDFMVPDIVEFRENLPKTTSGKIDKQLLMNESSNDIK